MKRKMSAGGRRPLVDRLESRSYLTAVSFSGPTVVSGVDDITGIATGDLTGNGQSDIVVAGVAPGTTNPVLGIYLSMSGTFSTPTLIPLNDPTGGVAIGDFLGNGHQDIAVIDGPIIDLFLNDGSGNFSQGVGAGLMDSGDTSMAVGDFLKNGMQDVAVVDPTANQVQIFNSNVGISNGVMYQDLASSGAPVSVPSPTKVVVGDFNNDGFPDLAILSSASPNSIYVAMNNGQGGFDTPIQYSLGTNIQSISDLAVADFSGSTLPDIIGLGTESGTGVSVATVLLNQGGGVFTAGSPVSVSAGGLLAVTGTFSGSGNQDFGSINSTGGLDILPGNGAGGFGQDQQVFTTELATPTTQAVAGDFTGDGRPDIAYISSAGGFGVLLNTTGGSLMPPLISGTPSTLTAKIVGPLPTAPVVAGVKIKAIREKVVLTNTASTTVKGPVSVSLLLSANTAGSTADPVLATLNIHRLTLKSHKSATEVVTIKAPLPSSANGSYYQIALVTDPSKLQSAAASSSTFSVVQPFVDLSGAFTKVPPSAQTGRPAPFSFNVTNGGTISAVGPLEIKIYASASGLIDSGAVEIDDLNLKHVSIAPGKPLRIRLSKTIAQSTAGKYFVILNVDPANTFHESNLANNTIVSPSAVVVG